MAYNEELAASAERIKERGLKVVTCNGCFDVLHVGHVKLLEEAKKQGDYLIVGLNSDEYITKNKGEDRPINNEEDRIKMLSSLKAVDSVVVFREKTPLSFLEAIKPDVHVDAIKTPEEIAVVERNGGRVYHIKLLDDYSSSDLIDRIRKI